MRAGLALLFFVVFVCIDGWLLYVGTFEATGAISFFVVFTMFCFGFYLIAQIEEISILGSILKLREVRKDADDAIRDLQASRLAMFSLLLESTKKFSGGFAGIFPEDERLRDFWFLYEKISSAGLVEELKDKIAGCAKLYMRAQISCVMHYSNIDCNRSYTPSELTVEALKSENLLVRNLTPEQTQKNALEAVEHYRKLYDLLQKTQA